MVIQWAFFYLSGQIPELETEPYRILFHIVGEMVTAAGLVIGGVGLLGSLVWGRTVYLLAMGMLFYTVIVSPGYFAQKGQWAPVVMFAILLVMAILSVILVL